MDMRIFCRISVEETATPALSEDGKLGIVSMVI